MSVSSSYIYHCHGLLHALAVDCLCGLLKAGLALVRSLSVTTQHKSRFFVSVFGSTLTVFVWPQLLGCAQLP